MSINASGQLRSIAFNSKKWRFPSDIDVTFWPGGRHNSEFQDDNAGGTAIQKNTTGKITGVVFRTSKSGDLASLVKACKDTVTTAKSFLFEFANGEKWSAPVVAIIDEGGPLTSAESKFSVDFYAANDTGEFVQV